MSAQRTTDQSSPTVVATPSVLGLLARAEQVPPGVPLLIRGEPGTGKDSLARLIHSASARRLHPFVKVSCATQPLELCEVDLFGEERGASPLANRRRLGGFEVANHGTLYLDELGALSPGLVSRCLRVLKTGEVSRAGGGEVFHIDVRLIASATDTPPARRDGEIRCLEAVELHLPPLRQRADEIPILVSFFLEQLSRRYRRDVQLCSETLAAFQAHAWPGNLCELEKAVHQSFLGSRATVQLTV